MKSILTLLCTTVLLAGTAYAQDGSCDIVSEEIIPLRTPSFDVPILWKRTMGVEGPDLPVDLISLADGGFVVVGESAKYDKDKGMGPRQLYLARIDINGKVIWEKREDIKGFTHAAAGIAIKDRLTALIEVQTGDIKTAQLNFYDGLGALKSSKSFSDPVYNLTPEGVVADAGSTSMTVALWAVNRKNPDDNFTILKQITLDGKDLANRQYLPGVPNHLESFRKMANGDLLGSGQITTNGIVAGWIFNVSGKKGDMIFQRPYARGAQSNLRNVVEDGQGNYYAIGDSIPTNDGLRAAWIMKINSDGEPVWQRYVQGKYAFSGKDITVLKDGRVLALVNARPVESEGGREHVRLLTFTAQGRMLGDEALIEGANAQAVDLLARERSRIITGVTQSGLADYALAADQKAAGYDFWVLGLPKLSNYSDPCVTRKNTDTFDSGF